MVHYGVEESAADKALRVMALALAIGVLWFWGGCNQNQESKIESEALDGAAASKAAPACALRIKKLLATCPASGSCVVSAPDALGRVAHCYSDGSKDIMAVASESVNTSVFRPGGGLCFRVLSNPRDLGFDIVASDGAVLATVSRDENGLAVGSCDDMTFDLEAHRPANSLRSLEGCVQGDCAFPSSM